MQICIFANFWIRTFQHFTLDQGKKYWTFWRPEPNESWATNEMIINVDNECVHLVFRQYKFFQKSKNFSKKIQICIWNTNFSKKIQICISSENQMNALSTYKIARYPRGQNKWCVWGSNNALSDHITNSMREPFINHCALAVYHNRGMLGAHRFLDFAVLIT